MPASLTIKLISPTLTACENLDLFQADSWTSDTEKQLLSRFQEFLYILKGIGANSIEVQFHVQVNDVPNATLQISKKINKQTFADQNKLSLREIEVLGLIMQGYTNQEIADKLFVSFETIKSHRKSILLKTNTHNTAALINHYHQTFFDKT